MQPDGAYRITAGQEVVLALRGGDWIEPMVELVDEEAGQSREWELEIEADDFIRLGKLKPGTYTVHVRDWELVSIRLACIEAQTGNVKGVSLRTATLDGANEFCSGLFDSDAAERWSALISGRELWRGIDLPDNWPVSLSWSAKAVGEVSQRALATSEAVAGAISDCLAADPDYSSLDAGVFGKIAYEKPAVQAKTSRLAEKLPVPLRSRLRWLILARASIKGSAVPIALSIPIERACSLREPDRRLVTGFLEVTHWPVVLIPQARSVGQEVARQLRCER
jgi:hypothetical protein